MTTIKALADDNQSGELFTVIISQLTTPAEVWAALSSLLQAVADRPQVFGPIAGELTVRDDEAPGGYARWTLSLPESIVSLRDLPAGTRKIPAEGALGTRCLIWLPPSTTQLEYIDLQDAQGLKNTTVALQPPVSLETDDIASPSDPSLQPRRIPQLPLRSPGNSALSLHVFHDEPAGELSLSVESWLDLWSPVRFDGAANDSWAQINRAWLQEIFDRIAREADAELEIAS